MNRTRLSSAALVSLLVLAATACGDTQTAPEWPEDCEVICDSLVTDCAYEAYPTMDSCLQGCSYDIELGKDVASQRSCVETANCDLFAIVECQHHAD